MYINDERLPFTVKYYQMSRIKWSVKLTLKILAYPGGFFEERIGSQDKVLDRNPIKEHLIKESLRSLKTLYI